jgi:formyl-CoA transferase
MLDQPNGPLSGLTVFDIGRFVAGPVTATILGEFGARVIKFEKLPKGDEIRQLGPAIEEGSAWWAVEGRNKETVTLDLSEEKGQELFKRLVPKADVVVENFRPGRLEAWGLGYETLAGLNSRLILLRTSGYGQSGPYRLFPGLNTAGEALGGLRYIMGDPDRPPTRPGIALADYTAAFMGAVGVLISLYERDRLGGSGRGQWIDNTLYESVMRLMEWTFVAYHQSGTVRERIGAGSAGTVPARAYQSKDSKWVGVAAAGDQLFARLAAAIGRADLARDERFATNTARVANRTEIDKIIGEWVAKYDAAQVVKTLREAQVPTNPVCSVADIFVDEHISERESLIHTKLPSGRDVMMQTVVPRLSRTPGGIRWAGRPLGSDTHSVLADLLGKEAAREFDDG